MIFGAESADTGERLINKLEKGKYFGEVSLITNMKRTCTVKAMEFTTLATLNKEDFMKAEDLFPSIFKNFKEGINLYNDADIQFRRNMILNVPYFRLLDENIV